MLDSFQEKRAEDKEQRRREILEATEAIISEQGWKQTTYSRVAKRANIARSLVYVYFPSRDDLFHAICDRGAEVLTAQLAAAAASASTGLEKVEAMAHAYQRFAQDYPTYFSLHAEELAGTGDGDSRTRSGESHPVFVLLGHALQQGIEDGSIKIGASNIKLTALTLWSFTHGLILTAERKAHFLKTRMRLEPFELTDHGFAMLKELLARGS